MCRHAMNSKLSEDLCCTTGFFLFFLSFSFPENHVVIRCGSRMLPSRYLSMYFVGPFGMHNTCRGYVYASSLTDKRLFLAQALTLDTCNTAPPSV